MTRPTEEEVNEEEYKVNFTITVEHVFNLDENGHLPYEAAKHWQYYHIEYGILPQGTSLYYSCRKNKGQEI